MKILGMYAGVCALVGGLPVWAENSVSDRDVRSRQHVMELIGQQTEILRLMAHEATAFDARAARTAAGEISEYARGIPNLYQSGPSNSPSSASSRVWNEFERFQQQSFALAELAEAACEDITSLADLQGAYTAIEATCQSCHQDFTE